MRIAKVDVCGVKRYFFPSYFIGQLEYRARWRGKHRGNGTIRLAEIWREKTSDGVTGTLDLSAFAHGANRSAPASPRHT